MSDRLFDERPFRILTVIDGNPALIPTSRLSRCICRDGLSSVIVRPDAGGLRKLSSATDDLI